MRGEGYLAVVWKGCCFRRSERTQNPTRGDGKRYGYPPHDTSPFRTETFYTCRLWRGNPARRHERRRARYELPQPAHDVHRHALQLPLARERAVPFLFDGPLPRPHPEARGEQ